MRRLFMHRWKLYYFVMLIIVLWYILTSSNVVMASGYKMNRVLFISSYSPSFQTFFRQVDGIRSELDNMHIMLDIEFMNSERFFTEESIANFYENLSYKIKKLLPYDVIIVADDNALKFILTYKEKLFPETPIVFMGINDLDNAERASQDPNITGVVETVSMEDTIAIARKLRPKAVNVVALIDNTSTGASDRKTYGRLAPEFPDLNFETLSLGDLTYEQFKKQLGLLNEEDIVLLLSVYHDKTNRRISFQESVNLILNHCDQPVFHPYHYGIKEGLIGGRVVSHYEQGKQAGMIAKDILNGMDIAFINPINETLNPYVFNYKTMQKHQISTKWLPKNSMLIHADESIFQKYGAYIGIVILIIVIQLMIIIALIKNIYKRKLAEQRLKEKQTQCVVANNDLTLANEELSATFEEIEIKSRQINELVYEDRLTGLKNRYAMTKTIDRIIATSAACKMAIMFLDIDDFKYINDTLGHDMGDYVIKIIGKKLKLLTKDHIHIGRFGGDEFLVMIHDYSSMDDINDLIEAIHHVFDSEIKINHHKLYITVSMGVVLYPTHGLQRGELIKKADMALYQAKGSGKNTHVLYDESMNQELEEKLILQGAIKQAVLNEEFTVYYQPYVEANSHEIIGFEALIRWFSEEHGTVSPYKLITLAEEMGLIVEIGQWVLKEACQFAKEINRERDVPLSVSVNVSPVQLKYHGFYEQVVQTLQEVGIPSEYLCLEMTETVLLESLESSVDSIQKLRDYGIHIALDDFGSGYSSLQYLKELPVNVMKIDRSFISHVAQSEYDQFFIQAMIMIAHKKGLTVVAEGIETKDQLEVLTAIGCDLIQGYYFSKPRSKKDAMTMSI
ncbi:EAL domain-containing protein [Vallitalea pronyensis]|uniref:EAL domain-containing protein n=1 Tax=Vallitalea pronyensis TaxID=1348613 RepID=A0A8J8SGA5_9FIRM|nr:ABC transporter substrate binding protein [Vallitalea pronyensis]QUI22391.1 EAL domain-containing protein [Vallitalea pronyensis]